MKGYYTSNGFYGYVNGSYQYFASQTDYYNEFESLAWHDTSFDKYEDLLDDQWD